VASESVFVIDRVVFGNCFRTMNDVDFSRRTVFSILQGLGNPWWSIFTKILFIFCECRRHLASVCSNAVPGLSHSAAFLHRYRHLLYNFQPESLQGGDVHGCIRQQPNPLDAQVRQDLAA
jgi:hypothetical protein